MPILAGTDANHANGAPAVISHGESLHHELELLVDAGLSTVDALRAAPHCRRGTSVSPTAASLSRGIEPTWC